MPILEHFHPEIVKQIFQPYNNMVVMTVFTLFDTPSKKTCLLRKIENRFPYKLK